MFREFLSIYQAEINNSLLAHYNEILKNDDKFIGSPIIVKISVDYKQLMQANSSIKTALNYMVDEPIHSLSIIKTASWIHMSENGGIPIQYNQIHFIIRFTNLPLTREFRFIPYRYPMRLSLSIMKCCLNEFGEVYQCIRQSIWYCSKQCSNQFMIGLSNVNEDKCTKCNSNLIENESQRSVYNCRVIHVYHANSVETPNQCGRIHRDIAVKLNDDLCNIQLNLGHIYVLILTYDIMQRSYNVFNFYKYQD